ncbi:MAG: gliding motility-associated protein GldM [bacterium F082]|nr:MAG: gliding motility-associated protein GldM [bacterium F082]KWW28950.1 MAG: gliding motility-associated protein GldM [bacterium P201]
MSGAKETPRQKMIGMMYLVYTALLAMNVSKDILDAFDTVNNGVQTTNITLANQIDQKYAAFEEQYSKEPEKAGPFWEQAQALREEANDLIDYVEALKWDLVKKVECSKAETPTEAAQMALETGLLRNADTLRNGRKMYDINTSKVKSRDNYNQPTAYMMGNPEGPGNGGKAYELSEKIRRFRGEVVKAMGPAHIHEIGMITDSIYGTKEYVMEQAKVSEDKLKRLPLEGEVYGAKYNYDENSADPVQNSWEYNNFHHTVLVADVTLLNKIISEAQTAELNAVTQLMTNIHASDFTFDEIGAKVFAESGYLLSGQTYKAQAMVTAWQNAKTTATVSLDGGPMKEYTSDGQGLINLEFNCGVGSHRYNGVIKMLDPKTGELKDYTFENSFVVAPPAVSVSATKMNVVYRGINNPIAVGGGVGGEINASASSGSLTRTGNGTYNLLPGAADEVTISVTSGGSSLGSMKFRVKDLPKPTALIRNVVNGQVSKSALQAAGRVEAEMKDFDFDGVHYDVVGYTFRYKTKSGTTKEAKANSGGFTDEIRNAISQANVGDMFVFTAIQVRGNDGKTKTIETPIGVEIK